MRDILTKEKQWLPMKEKKKNHLFEMLIYIDWKFDSIYSSASLKENCFRKIIF